MEGSLGRGFDVIHGCNPPDLIFLVALPFKPIGKRFVFDHHDINPELYEAKFNKRGFFWRLLVLFERMTFFFADVVISTNESYRKIAIERGRQIAGSRLRRAQRAGPAPREDGAGRPAMEEGAALSRRLRRRDRRSGGHRPPARRREALVFEMGRKDIQFVLVGDGPSRKRMEALSIEMGLADYVTFLGRAPDAELFSVLSSADVCVNPDRVNPMNNLSTMNKILEYMAMKKPIVQFDVVEGRVSAGDASLYAKPNDPVDFAEKIVELLADPAAVRADGRDRPRADRERALVGPAGPEAGERVRDAVRAALIFPSAIPAPRLDVWSGALMVRSCPAIGRMRYGPGSHGSATTTEAVRRATTA